MARCFGASIAHLVFWQLVAGFLSLGMAEFNYLPDYLYPPADFEWNPGQYLPMCEVCPQVQAPTLLRVDEADCLIEMDEREVEIIMEEAVESKENVMQQQIIMEEAIESKENVMQQQHRPH